MGKLIIVRGIPGTGKSTKAKELMHQIYKNTSEKVIHVEADMYFERFGGIYNWNPELLRHAHRWCIDTALVYLEKDYNVIVSNTFTVMSEMSEYLDHVFMYNHEYEIITMDKEYGSIHSVPASTMLRMRERFMSHEEIILRIGIDYEFDR